MLEIGGELGWRLWSALVGFFPFFSGAGAGEGLQPGGWG